MTITNDNFVYVAEKAAMSDQHRRTMELWRERNPAAAWLAIEPHLIEEADRGRRSSAILGMLRVAETLAEIGVNVDGINREAAALLDTHQGGLTKAQRVILRRLYQGPSRPPDDTAEGRQAAKLADHELFGNLGEAREPTPRPDGRDKRITPRLLALILHQIPLIWMDLYSRALFRFIHIALSENGGRWTGMELSRFRDVALKILENGSRIPVRIRPSDGPPNKRRIHWRLHRSLEAFLEVLRVHPLNVDHKAPLVFLEANPDLHIMLDPLHSEEGIHLQQSTFTGMMDRLQVAIDLQMQLKENIEAAEKAEREGLPAKAAEIVPWHLGPNSYRRSRIRQAHNQLPRRLAKRAVGHVGNQTGAYVGMDDENLVQEREVMGYTQGILPFTCPCGKSVAKLVGRCPGCGQDLASDDADERRRDAGKSLAQQMKLEVGL